MNSPRACHFCRQPLTGKKSREHVFPRWLLRVLSSGRISVDATRYSTEGEPLSVRSHSLHEFVLGGVCRSCNHGWMSLLESQARPTMTPLVTGGSSVRALDPEERATVARWATKTAAVLNLATDFDRLFTPSLVRALRDDPLSLPVGISVLAGQHYPTHPSYWLQAPSVEFLLPAEMHPTGEHRSQIAQSGFRIGIQIGHLALMVVYWPHPQWPVAIWPELHVPLWPPDDSFVAVEHRFDGEEEPWNVNSHLFLYRAIDTIGAFSKDVVGLRLTKLKNRNTHVSGPEPRGDGSVLPIPSVLTPEDDRRIREWLEAKQRERVGRSVSGAKR